MMSEILGEIRYTYYTYRCAFCILLMESLVSKLFKSLPALSEFDIGRGIHLHVVEEGVGGSSSMVIGEVVHRRRCRNTSMPGDWVGASYVTSGSNNRHINVLDTFYRMRGNISSMDLNKVCIYTFMSHLHQLYHIWVGETLGDGIVYETAWIHWCTLALYIINIVFLDFKTHFIACVSSLCHNVRV